MNPYSTSKDIEFFMTIQQLHEQLGDPIDNCFIVNCKNKTEIKVRGNNSGRVYFVCAECAEYLISTRTHSLV